MLNPVPRVSAGACGAAVGLRPAAGGRLVRRQEEPHQADAPTRPRRTTTTTVPPVTTVPPTTTGGSPAAGDDRRGGRHRHVRLQGAVGHREPGGRHPRHRRVAGRPGVHERHRQRLRELLQSTVGTPCRARSRPVPGQPRVRQHEPDGRALLRVFRRPGRPARRGLLQLRGRRLAGPGDQQQRATPATARPQVAWLRSVLAGPRATSARWPTGTTRCSPRVLAETTGTCGRSGGFSTRRASRSCSTATITLRALRPAGCERPLLGRWDSGVHRRHRRRLPLRLQTIRANSEVRGQAHGVLKLTLRSGWLRLGVRPDRGLLVPRYGRRASASELTPAAASPASPATGPAPAGLRP